MFYLIDFRAHVSKVYVKAIRAVVLVLALSSCREGKVSHNVYYPLDSLLDKQINVLKTGKAKVEKTAWIDGEKHSRVFVPDSLQWVKEFEVFRDINSINKPVNAGSYTVEEGRDSRSNLTVRSFTAVHEALPVRSLKIYYLDNPGKIKRMEASYQEKNMMYKGSRQLQMEFHELNRIPYLASYSVNGGQKMLLGDTVQYAIVGKVMVNKD